MFYLLKLVLKLIGTHVYVDKKRLLISKAGISNIANRDRDVYKMKNFTSGYHKKVSNRPVFNLFINDDNHIMQFYPAREWHHGWRRSSRCRNTAEPRRL